MADSREVRLSVRAVVLATVALLALASPGAALAKAPTTPVVLVVFDELPVNSLLAANGRIDSVRYPNFARLTRDATWYSNATTASDSTNRAIPSVLDGRAPIRGSEATLREHPRNLFTLLHGQGYRLRVQEEATDLCPYRECRRRFGRRYFLAHDRLARFRRFVRSIKAGGGPAVYYKHTLLPHIPWVFLPTGQRYDETVLGAIRGINSSDTSVFEPTLVHQSWQRHLLQAGAVDTLLGDVIARLKQTGLYERAMVVVMADHGVSFRLGATDRRTLTPANAQDIVPIPLFVKDPRQRRGHINRSLVSTYDVLPTIAARIGLRLPRGLTGRAASSPAVRRRGRVTILSRGRAVKVTLSRARLLGLKRAALRRKIGLFGSGRRTLFDFGPGRRLRGRPVERLPVVRGGPLRARLNDPGDYVNVRPEADFLPIHLTGRINGGRRGSRRDVAVAVNGIVRGVTRSVRLPGRAPEYFTVLVAPKALAPGRNEVQVFAVSSRRGRYALRRIYGKPYRAPVVH